MTAHVTAGGQDPFMAVLQGDDIHESYLQTSVVSVRNRRAEQQDAALVTDWVCAVADGLGGHDRGADASITALRVLAERIDGPRDDAALRADIAAADDAVRSLATGERRNPGTTLVTVTVPPALDGVTVAWCGDSRAWLVEGDAVTLLTEDHCFAFGGLARCLGAHDVDISANPDTVAVAAGEGRRVLLTTDGAHGGLSERAEWLYPGLLAAGLEQLVRVGAELGTDNATALLVDIDALVRHARNLTA